MAGLGESSEIPNNVFVTSVSNTHKRMLRSGAGLVGADDEIDDARAAAGWIDWGGSNNESGGGVSRSLILLDPYSNGLL